MKKIFIVFTHKADWNIQGISKLIEGDNPGEKYLSGFSGSENHFALILFKNNKISGEFFGFKNFPIPKSNCILLIHNDEKISNWSVDEKEKLKNITKVFEKIYIYYHKRDKNRHQAIEKLIENTKNLKIGEGMHVKGNLYEKLDLLFDCKSMEVYNKRLVGFEKEFFNNSLNQTKIKTLNFKLAILHRILDNKLNDEDKDFLEKQFDFVINQSDSIKFESLEKIRNILVANN